MRDDIPEFAALYAKRHIQDNEGAMRFDHSFDAWYILRALQPPDPQPLSLSQEPSMATVLGLIAECITKGSNHYVG
jgi:hypothetical protein